MSELIKDAPYPESLATYEEGLLIGIEEAQNVLKRQHEGITALNAKARSLLSATSMILALIGTLQLTLKDYHGQAFWILFGAALVLYAVLVLLTTMVQQPVTLSGPVAAEWEVISVEFARHNRIEMLEQRLTDTLNAIDLNRPAISKKRTQSSFAGLLLPIIVVILLAGTFVA